MTSVWHQYDSSLRSHKINGKAVFTRLTVVFVTSELNFACKIGSPWTVFVEHSSGKINITYNLIVIKISQYSKCNDAVQSSHINLLSVLKDIYNNETNIKIHFWLHQIINAAVEVSFGFGLVLFYLRHLHNIYLFIQSFRNVLKTDVKWYKTIQDKPGVHK